MESLESVLDGVEAEVEPAVEQPVAETPEVKEEVAEPQVDEPTETGDKESLTPEPKAEEEPQSVPIKALLAERDKRQAAEARAQELEAQTPPPKAPDVFEDQGAYTDHMTQTINTAVFNQKANMSEWMARREIPDLDQKIEKYMELAKANPALNQQMYNAQSPYHEMSDIVDKHETLQEMKDIDGFKAKTRAEIEAEVRAEIKAEMEGKAKTKEELRDAIPTSLVDEPSKGGINKQAWDGPTPLDKVFGD